MIFYYQIFALLILNCFVITGFYKATMFEWLDDEYPYILKPQYPYDIPLGGIREDSKMILWKVRYYSLKWFGLFWSKPICTCTVCMASVHSTYVYFFFLYLNNFEVKLLWFYPIYILALAGVNSTYSSIVKD